MSTRVTVNPAKCQAYQRCMAVAPAAFRIDAATGKAEIFDATNTPQTQLVQAARSCPYRAITVVDEVAGVQLFPPPPRQTPASK